MSSPTTAEPEKTRRRFPPPCWTQDETLALIEAYRERWYALRRGYLRTPDWDAVAAAVATRCPAASPPPKSSAQCRHKMEKLRQRYRAEKQRALSFPNPGGRYFSSWFFFENMEAMENGTTPAPKPEISADGSKLKSFLDQNMLKLKIKAKESVDQGYGNGVKAKRFSSGSKVQPDQYSLCTDTDAEEEEDAGGGDDDLGRITQQPMMIGIAKSKSKKPGKMFDFSGGFHQQMMLPIHHQQMVLPPGLRMKKLDANANTNPIEEFWVASNNNQAQQHYTNNNYNSTTAPDLGSKYWPGSGPGSATHESLKRGRNAMEEIVESIKMLGEGYMKVERAKMEMAREMEAMRMEMEMKRNEMLLQSQKQIVDVFLKGLTELKQTKKKMKKTTDSAKTEA